MINKHKSNKIKENSNTVRHLNNGTDRRHSKSSCDQSSPARRTINSCYASGTYLVLDYNNDTNTQLAAIAAANNLPNVWIGGLGTAGDWTWTEGEWWAYGTITMTLHYHRQLDCWFNPLFSVEIKVTPRHHITGPLWLESTGDRWMPSQKGPVMRK